MSLQTTDLLGEIKVPDRGLANRATGFLNTLGRPADTYNAPDAPVFYRRVGKRAVDLALVILSAPLVLPLVALAAILTAMDGHSPFYTQKRIGRNGRVFRIWKLRTMVHDADARLEAYLDANPEAREEWETKQKLKNDPRVTTRVAVFLRKTSLDELPQLWNVLTGSMSLVGPRPMMVDQKSAYEGEAYYRMRPGLTGLWQISDRNEGSFAGRVAFDDRYELDMSFMTDVRIMFKTVSVVCRGTGW